MSQLGIEFTTFMFFNYCSIEPRWLLFVPNNLLIYIKSEDSLPVNIKVYGLDSHQRKIDFYFMRSGNQAKRSVEFSYSTRNASKRQKSRNGILILGYHGSCDSLCLSYYVRDKSLITSLYITKNIHIKKLHYTLKNVTVK